MDYIKVIELVKQTKQIVDAPISEEQIHVKGRADFVTDRDIQVQEFIQQRLHEMYPEIGFMGEETGYFPLGEKPVWILDPIDGTTNFIKDYKQSACSLALYDGKEIVFGVIYQFFSGEIFHAVKQGGAFLNGKPIHVSGVNCLHDALVSIGTSPYHKELAEDNFRTFQELFKQSNDIRRMGSAAMDFAYVACGRHDAYLEKHLKIWDCAAGILLVKEAGGLVCGYEDGDLIPSDHMDILAVSGPTLAEEIRNVIRKNKT